MSEPGQLDRPDPTSSGGRTAATPTAELMSAAWRAVGAATYATTAAERYAEAHLAALRAAAAVLAARTRPRRPGRTGAPPAASAWTLLSLVAPELREWSDFFTVSARVSHALRADPSLAPRLSERQADDLLRDSERFLTEVRSLLLRDRRRP